MNCLGPRQIRDTLSSNSIELHHADDMQRDLFKLIDVIEKVELYHSWVDPITVLNVTKKRYTRLLDMQNIFKLYVFKKRQNNVIKSLQLHEVCVISIRIISLFVSVQWSAMTPKEVMKEFREVLAVFAELLGTKSFLFGHRISELDCALFGHLYAILTTKYYGTFGPR